MKRLHPIRNCLATTALIVLSLGAGCKSTSSGVGNPFLAPDRVPPPGTHALLPGQAQPYYQGDPLPSSALAPPNASVGTVVANTTQTTLSPAGRTLAWNAPATAAVSAPTDPVASPPAASTVTTPPQTAVAANEASIAVPTDADPLRYPLP